MPHIAKDDCDAASKRTSHVEIGGWLVEQPVGD